MSEKKEKMDTALIRDLAAIITERDLGEIEIEHGDLRIRVSRHKPQPVQVAAPVVPPIAAPAMSAPAVAAPAVPGENHENAVKSPMVGTIYLSPEPGAARFVQEGDTVKEGQTLLLIEAMKTFNPVVAPRAGKVSKLLVEDAQPVEFGEALVIVD